MQNLITLCRKSSCKKAFALLASGENDLKGQVKLAAHMRILRGQIAERESRWPDGLLYYQHAARFDGSEDHFAVQARILWRLGRSA